MTGFRGTFTVMITPFDDAQAYDARAMARFTNWQIEQRIHGLIPLGSTGEFLSLTKSEQLDVAKTVVDTANGRVPVLLGAGAERTEDAIDKALMARDVGADGIMVISPYY